MPSRKTKTNKEVVDVCLRIRPLTGDEVTRCDVALQLETQYDRATRHQLTLTTPKTENDEIEFVECLGFRVPKSRPQKQKKYKGFTSIAQETSNNDDFFQHNVSALIDEALLGKTACCFAYGHTGSGKTHTVLGYGSELGMYQQASLKLFASLEQNRLRDGPAETLDQAFVQIRFGEIYNDNVYDLLDGNKKCFVREDAQKRIQIRGETITSAAGVVRSSYAKKKYAKSHDELLQIVQEGIQARATGNSNVHQHSSRSHAILELEITTQHILDLQEQLETLEAEATGIGHKRDILDMDIFLRQRVKVEGKCVLKPDAKGSTSEECDTLARSHGELLAAEKSIMIAKSNLKEAKSTEQMPCIGGTLVFSDLAGSEHAGSAMDGLQKTEQEQQECREINRSLSALKACFRSLASGLSSTSCYRQSKLTMVLRDHLRSSDSKTLMIATLSPSEQHTAKTIHTLQYAQIVSEC